MIKQGQTLNLVRKINLKKPYDKVIFRIHSEKENLEPIELTSDVDGIFVIPLHQADTEKLGGEMKLEAQICYTDKSVEKSVTDIGYVNDTLGTSIIDGNTPADDDGIPKVLEMIEGDVALIITPENSQTLIDAVTQLFQQTKSIAQSVRDDADEGKFDGKDGVDGKDGADGKDGIDGKDGKDGRDGVDGKDGIDGQDGKDGKDGIDGQDGADGFSPTVVVKTQTADTYILDITDKNGTIETPNLKGDKGDAGDYTAGNGIDILNDVISAKLKQGGFLLVTNDGIYVDASGLGWEGVLRENLSTDDGSTPYPLARKSYVDTEVAKKQNTINASNKLNADYLSDGTTSKPSYWNQAPKMYRGNGQPSTTASSYIGIRTGDLYLDEQQVGMGNMHLYQCTFYYMDELVWKEVSYTSNIKQVPTSTAQDNGKFLRVNAQGNAEWQTDNKQDKTTITTNSTDTTVNLTVADNNEYRYTQDLSSLTLTMPSGEFIASVVFVSGTTPTQMTYDSSIKWSGDDVTSNAFVPQVNKTYNIVLWYDGININAIARGV